MEGGLGGEKLEGSMKEERVGERLEKGGENGDVQVNQEEVRISMDDMLSALREVRPSAMREVTLEVPKVSELKCGDP